MGSALGTCFRQKPVKVFFFGLTRAGKTTLLYRLLLGEVINAIPTMFLQVEEVEVNGMKTIMWEIGLRTRSRPFIRHYADDADGVLFLIDSTDRDRLTEAVDEFFEFLNDTVQERQLPVAVLANKQDGEVVLSCDEIKQALFAKGGEVFRVNTVLEVFPTVTLTLEGVDPVLEWLTSQMALRIASRSYLPSLVSLWSKAAQYPASILKTASRNFFSGPSTEQDEKKLQGETMVGS